MHTTGNGCVFAFKQAIRFELQPPFYFVTLSVIRQLHESVFFARLFSVACCAASIYLMGALARRFFPTAHPGPIVVLLAFNPLLIRAAIDMRCYALVILLSTILLHLFFDGFLASNRSRTAQFGYFGASVISLYTQYYLGFLLAGNAVALLVLGRWSSLRAYFVGMIFVAALFAPMIPAVLDQVPAHSSTIVSQLSWQSSVHTLMLRFDQLLVPTSPELEWVTTLSRSVLRLCALIPLLLVTLSDCSNRARIIASLSTIVFFLLASFGPVRFFKNDALLAGIILLLIILCIKRNKCVQLQTFLTLCSLLMGSWVGFILAVQIVGADLIDLRHLLSLLLPTILLFCSSLLIRNHFRFLALLVILIIGGHLALYVLDPERIDKPGRSKMCASYVMANETANQPILMFPSYYVLPFSHHYGGVNYIIPIPIPPRWDRHSPYDYRIRDLEQLEELFASLPKDTTEIWFIWDGVTSYLDVSLNYPVLKEFIDREFQVAQVRRFRGCAVWLLIRKSTLAE